MYGVVLWCSVDSQRAVIWCEDHGDLAYCQDIGVDTVLEAGDLVLFQSVQSRRMRMAQDVRLVDQGRFANLPDRLKAASVPACATAQRAESGTVVAFNPAANTKRRVASRKSPVAAVL